MTFHEARTQEDFRKVLAFIMKQPEFSTPRLCVNPILREKTPSFIEKILTEGVDLGSEKPLKGFHLFWVEDQEQMKATIFIRRKLIPNRKDVYKFVLQAGFCVVDTPDYEANNGEYFKELCLGMAKHFGSGGIGEFRVAGNFLGWVQDIFKPHTKIKRRETIKNWTTGEPMDTYIVILTWEHLL